MDPLLLQSQEAKGELAMALNRWAQFGIEHGERARELSRKPGNPGHDLWLAVEVAKKRRNKIAAKIARLSLARTSRGRMAV